jgi:hypothetical protein
MCATDEAAADQFIAAANAFRMQKMGMAPALLLSHLLNDCRQGGR